MSEIASKIIKDFINHAWHPIIEGQVEYKRRKFDLGQYKRRERARACHSSGIRAAWLSALGGPSPILRRVRFHLSMTSIEFSSALLTSFCILNNISSYGGIHSTIIYVTYGHFRLIPCPDGKVWLEVWFGGMIRGMIRGYDSRRRKPSYQHWPGNWALSLSFSGPAHYQLKLTWLWPPWANRVWFGYDSGMIRVWFGHNPGLGQ